MKNEDNANPLLVEFLIHAAGLADLARMRCRQRVERICADFTLAWNRYLKYLQQDDYFKRTSFTEAQVLHKYLDGRITLELPEYYPAKWIASDEAVEPTTLQN